MYLFMYSLAYAVARRKEWNSLLLRNFATSNLRFLTVLALLLGVLDVQ